MEEKTTSVIKHDSYLYSYLLFALIYFWILNSSALSLKYFNLHPQQKSQFNQKTTTNKSEGGSN